MQLDLVHRRHDRRLAQQLIESVRHEGAHADRAHPPIREQLLECAIGADRAVEGGRQRLMQKQQVELLDAELADALLERVQRLVIAIIADPDLRLDEDFVTRNTGAANAFADFPLVEVRRRGIDEAVAYAERRLDRGRRLSRRALKDAEAQRGELDAVVQLDVRHVRLGHLELSPLVKALTALGVWAETGSR